MSDAQVDDGTSDRLRRLVTMAGGVVLRGTLYVSPKPMVFVLRRQFASGADALAARLMRDAPSDVVATIDEPYDDDPDAVLDVYTPRDAATRGERLPTIVWTHGGAFIGGSKEEIGGYLRMIAGAGFTVVGVRYTLAPEARHPAPTRQMLAALRHLEANADRLHVDPRRFVLVGDSAGAQISAQAACVVTNPTYARRLEIEPSIAAEQLRGVALCCGVFDLAMVEPSSPFRMLIDAVGWAYSGTRDFRNDQAFISTVSVPPHVTADFPPSFLTVGNTDPLRRQSIALAEVLRSKKVDVETLFYPDDHSPNLDHEYQFNLDLDDARAAFDRMIDFYRRVTQPS
jgi:acetyl esterase/lipase